ncbi:alpha/beta hydrolase [Caballeronia sordidicola]|uniref:alpha/beta hydrolase n=1 Tax=Caballeronia sordidicola TaxID=196367 RepID=UPI000B10CD36|nr:alpha/beta hydrolase [Caballeronia sordidicola]
MSERRILLTGGRVLSTDTAIGDLPKGDILVEGKGIAAPPIAAHDARRVDAIGTGVLRARPDNADTVFVAGRAIKRHGRILNVDVHGLRQRACFPTVHSRTAMSNAATPLPLDPELAAVVSAMRVANAPPPFSGTPAQARERMRCAIMAARERFPLPIVGAVEDALAVFDGAHVPVRVYRPQEAQTGLPTVVFFHGGGFVLGSVELMDDIARKLCRDMHAVVVSVDYRLAPEHPFPAAHDDALTATLWAIRNVSVLGGDESRVAVAGESAGGNLAASTALTLRDRKERLAAQLLVVPGVDLARDTLRIEAKRSDFPMLSPADLRDISRLYMGSNSAQAGMFPPSPLHATAFSGLPPAVLAIAGQDPLCEEGLAYAARLDAAGVPVEVLRFEDMFHPFLGFFEVSVSARRANDEICRAFAALLQRRPAALDSLKSSEE